MNSHEGEVGVQGFGPCTPDVQAAEPVAGQADESELGDLTEDQWNDSVAFMRKIGDADRIEKFPTWRHLATPHR